MEELNYLRPDCNVSNGSVTVVTTGGSGDYTYSNTNNLPSGENAVVVIDNVTGCQITVDFILENNIPNATITVDPVLILPCAGDENGTVVYTVTYDPGFVGSGRKHQKV